MCVCIHTYVYVHPYRLPLLRAVLGRHTFSTNPVRNPDAPAPPGGIGRYTRVALEPVTGRSQQLRVHLAYFGHSIVGDALHGNPISGPARPIPGSAISGTVPSILGDALHGNPISGPARPIPDVAIIGGGLTRDVHLGGLESSGGDEGGVSGARVNIRGGLDRGDEGGVGGGVEGGVDGVRGGLDGGVEGGVEGGLEGGFSTEDGVDGGIEGGVGGGDRGIVNLGGFEGGGDEGGVEGGVGGGVEGEFEGERDHGLTRGLDGGVEGEVESDRDGDGVAGVWEPSRLYLHAAVLKLRHPTSGEWMKLVAPPPF